MKISIFHIHPAIVLALIYCTGLTFFSLEIPFLWDSSFFSQLAHHFYENGFGNFISPLETDTGSFPFFSSYLALAWKIFGKTLWVSHLAFFPWLIGVIYEYYRLAKRFLNRNFLFIAMLLLIAEPAFSAQSIIMAYDVPLVFIFLFSINSMLDGKRMYYTVALCLMTFYSVRGMMLVPAFFILDSFIVPRLKTDFSGFKARSVLYYLFPAVSLCVWMLYHYSQTGWCILSPFTENRGGELNSFSMAIRQVIFSVWHLLDSGRVFLTGFVLIILFRSRSKNLFLFFILMIIPFIINLIFMAPLSNPIGHRYFLSSIVLLPFVTAYALQVLNKRKTSYVLAGLFAITSITGNFWIYPERFGNGWDASLKMIPVFNAVEEMTAYTSAQAISPEDVGAEYPFHLDRKFSHLEENSNHFTFLGDKPVISFRYVLRSNVCNTARLEELKKIENEWVLVKEIESGQAYLRLYRNPVFPGKY